MQQTKHPIYETDIRVGMLIPVPSFNETVEITRIIVSNVTGKRTYLGRIIGAPEHKSRWEADELYLRGLLHGLNARIDTKQVLEVGPHGAP